MNPTPTPAFDVAMLWQIAGWVVIGVGGLVLLWALFRDRARGKRRCPKCWYDMMGVPGLRCPECGREAKNEKRLLRTRRRWRWTATAVLLLLAGMVSLRVPRALEHGWLDAVPVALLRPALWWERERAEKLFNDAAFKTYGSGLRMAAPPPSALTQWDKLLIAYQCGQRLDEMVRLSQAPQRTTSAEDRYQQLRDDWAYGPSLSFVRGLGREARPAAAAMFRAAWLERPFVDLTQLTELEQQLGTDISGELQRIASRHQSAGVRSSAVAILVHRAVNRDRVSGAVIGLSCATAANAEAACSRILASQHAQRSSASYRILRAMLASPDDGVQAMGVWCLASIAPKEFEAEFDSMWKRGVSGRCTTAMAFAAGEYQDSTDRWGPRLCLLCESLRADTCGRALRALTDWAKNDLWGRDELVAWLAELDRLDRGARVARGAGAWIEARLLGSAEYGELNMAALAKHSAADAQEEALILLRVLQQHHAVSYRISAATELESHDLPADVAFEVLVEVLSTTESGLLRQCALDGLGPSIVPDPRLRPVLMKAFDDERVGAVAAAVRLAGDMPPDPGLIARITEFAQLEKGPVRVAAVPALKKLLAVPDTASQTSD